MPVTCGAPTFEIRIRPVGVALWLWISVCLAFCQTTEDDVLVRAKAFDALRARDYEAAESLFRHALELNPKSSETYDGLSLVLSELNRLLPAIEAARQAIALEEDEPLPHYHL